LRKLFSAAVFLAMLSTMLAGPTSAAASTHEIVAQSTTAQATITGTVTTTAGTALAGASVTANGAGGTITTTTDATGKFTLNVVPGGYTIITNRGGFQSAESDGVIAVPSTTTTLRIALSEANLSSLQVIGRSSGSARRALNTSSSAVVSVSAETFLERETPRLNDLAAELPGVTIQRGGASPNADFVIRGGLREARTQIDGHSVGSGNFGAYNTGYTSPFAFSSIEVTKGPGIFGANAGETAFGTVNLVTPDFSNKRTGTLLGGFDSNGGSFDNFLYKDSLLNGKISIVGQKTFTGSNFGGSGFSPRVQSATVPIINYFQDISNPQFSQSALAKARYKFTDSTSISFEFLGLNGGLRNQGGNYATYLPNQTIPLCANGNKLVQTGGAGCTLTSQYNNPLFQNLIGTSQNVASAPGVGSVYDNEQIWGAEFRTAIKNDTLLIRPYTANILRFIDGANETQIAGYSKFFLAQNAAACTGIYNGATNATGATGKCFQGTNTTPFTTPTNPCPTVNPTVAIPANACYIPGQITGNSGVSAYATDFGQPEKDVLHGTTVTYIHPVRDNVFSVSYDYNSDNSTFLSGDLSPYTAAPPTLANNNLNEIPSLIRKNTLSFASTLQLSQQLQGSLGLYFFNWRNNTYQEDPAILNAAVAAKTDPNASILSLVPFTKTYSHFDPHIGLTYRLGVNSIVRASFGSAITTPYPGIASTLPSLSLPGAATPTVYSYQAPNANLRPQTTVAYNLGGDFRLPDGGVITVDGFSNLVYDAFATSNVPYTGGNSIVVPAGFTIVQNTSINAGLRRNYGVEFTIDKSPAVGFGYRLTTTLQRNFFDKLDPSLFATPNTLVPLQQVNGQPTIPYSKAYGEVRFAGNRGTLFTLGAEYTGPMNQTDTPAFTIYNSSLRIPIDKGYTFTIAAENFGNYQTGYPGFGSLFGAGYAPATYQLVNGQPVYGQRSNFSALRIPEKYIRFFVTRKF